MEKKVSAANSVMREVSHFISKSGDRELPAEVISKAKHHILDTLAAMVSGSKLKPGLLAKRYVGNQGGVPEAQVTGSPIVTSATNAALANGIMAHADETDDSNPRALTHPGCSIVPAALSMSEREEADGMSFLKGVVVGYDIGCRITQALGVENLRKMSRCTHSVANNFGAAAAAGAIARLKDDQLRYVLSYASQQASGLFYMLRDQEHIEKAFVFGGMPARNGVTAAILVQSGFSGVWDAFSGDDNFFQAFSPNSRPELLAEGLGSRHEIMYTNLKKFSVGSPIQAPTDAILWLIDKYKLESKDIESIIVRLPYPRARAVDNRDMPDINLQYILAVTLLDGDLTFEQAHSYERMKDPAVLEIRKRIALIEDKELNRSEAIVGVTTKDGTKFKKRTVGWRGTSEDPLTTGEVEKKCRELLVPVLEEERSQKLIETVWNLEKVRNMRELRPLLNHK